MAHWKDVALYSLCYDSSMVEALEKRYPDDCQKCCFYLFDDWLSTENGISPKTWETLLTQLKKLEEHNDKIKVNEIITQLNR